MLLQKLVLHVSPENHNDFESAVRSMFEHIAGMRGYMGHELYKCVENEHEYMIMLRLGSIQNYADGLHRSQELGDWLKALQPFFKVNPAQSCYIDIRVESRAQLEQSLLQEAPPPST
ncbi:antibiotic biosynthesis monooxygenase [Paenibacillus sp. F411]|uniref:Antibiotic biosynthesis monooxygenase n=1 Tax=Paenibacillus algicola TaxID=2565926 RepID=A0A4P8XKV8_9BACL|nr:MULTISPECIES: antibiotic biosynthesis monooxygenase [Paenibacillus]MBO2944217.1 antibiotic biosynthesis monooxygenase [Paenibacillus sp. F411]QCT03068.1 Antibiotic biosynthesis monooxygenase [Paenibacillus algicola]